ncbi:proline-rich protein 36 isoform X6 [Drosophila rhopaloa]|uniref:Mucin-17 n=1 Tax=Drosophila rhopaloa TaxID=1041015 RepID=A0ABM5J3K4_DRORH|nr:proline-rich protein 36 isoform X6 [Drosophila rhopaloa]
MEDIEYLDEYKDLVLPGIKTSAPPASSAGVSRPRRISSDSSNSSSIDADIFQKLFHGKYNDDDDLLDETSGSKSKDRRRRSPSPYSSSDVSNDALETLFCRNIFKSKPNKRRERYESFDSVDDLGAALMRPSQRLTVPKPSTSQAGARKSLGEAPHRSGSNSSSGNFGKSTSNKPLPASPSKTAANPSLSAKNKNPSSLVSKPSDSINGSGLSSAKNKTVTIIKAQKTNLTPSQHEPKTDPLTLGDYDGDSESDSSYEYESDFYGDRDSEDEDAEPVIDISTDTSRTTSVAEAAKRKQLQQREKSATERQDHAKPVRRRHLLDEEEPPTLKRSKIESEAKSNVKGKFISIIGNETIMSSTTAPIKETRSETSPAVTKSAVKTPKQELVTKHIIVATPARKQLNPESPSPATKKPMVQTLLSSTLSLQKPSSGDDVSSTSTRKTQNKSETEKNRASDQPILGSSIVVTRKSLPATKKNESLKEEGSSAAPRKVNISVSVVPSKEAAAEASKSPAATPETSPILPRKAQLETKKMARKSEVIKKVEANKKDDVTKKVEANKKVEVFQKDDVIKKAEASKKVVSEKDEVIKKVEANKKAEAKKKAVLNDSLDLERATEPSKKSVTSVVRGRKQNSQSEAPKKPESRKSQGLHTESNPRKAAPQANRSKKFQALKSEVAALDLNDPKPLPQTDVTQQTGMQISTDASKAVVVGEIARDVKAEEIGATDRGRGAAKRAKQEQRKSRGKPGLSETTSDSRDSSRDDSARKSRTDKQDQNVSVTHRQFALGKSVHMTRATSSNRSLAATPAPMSGRQRNASKDRFSPFSEQKQEPKESQSLRGRQIRRVPVAPKRKAVEVEEAIEGVNPKRPRELQGEDMQHQEDPGQEILPVAFPVKITAASLASSEEPLAVPSTVEDAPPKAKLRKLCVKINRRIFNNWLSKTREKNQEKQDAPQKLPSPPPLPEASSETDSAAESMSESMLPPQTEPAAVFKAVPESQPEPNPPTTAPELPVRKSSTLLAPKSAHVPSAAPALLSDSAEVLPVVPVPVKAITKTAIYPLTEQHLSDKAPLLDSAQKLENQRRVQMFHAKSMPLPVPIPEVKSEPEDAPPEIVEEDPFSVLPTVAAAEEAPQPLPVIETIGPPAIQSNNLATVSSGASVSHSIPSASAPSNNPNGIGQTKMFSFLYPKRYKRSYDDVGLDFCCPNLDGPMRAIDFTRLHSTAEVPVLEVPQFLVITTKFISKADKNIPSKVRAKLELLGRNKVQDSREPVASVSNLASGEDVPANALDGSVTPAPTSIIQSFPPAPPGDLSLPSPAVPPIPAPSSIPIALSNPTPAEVSSPAILDSLTKQLPRGTTLTKKVLHPGATLPPTASTSMLATLPPSLIQLPPICPTDKQRVELQTRVQVFDMVLQALSRRVSNLTLAERQRTIEEIVRTSSVMAIDVDVGTKLLENYVRYLNKATNTITPLPPVRFNSVITPMTSVGAAVENPSSSVAASSSPLSKNVVSSTMASVTPTQATKKTTQHAQQRSSLPASVPLFDAEKNIIGFQCPNPKAKTATPTSGRNALPAATSTPLGPSTSSAAAAANLAPRNVSMGAKKKTGEDPSQIVNLKTTVSMTIPSPKVVAKKRAVPGTMLSINPPTPVQKPVLCKKKTTPVRTATQTKTIPSPATSSPATRSPATRFPASRAPTAQASAKPKATPSTTPGVAPVAKSLAPAGMSLSSTSNPNVFIINQASQPEESILPDTNNTVAPMEAEIKGELDDSSEIII